MQNAYTGFNAKHTPQNEIIPGQEAKMIPNSAGGYGYRLDDQKCLERFLILGSEGGSYYVSEQKLTKEAAKRTIAFIEADGRKAVDLIVAISQAGRAPKNDPALFALALAAASQKAETRSYALSQLNKVARIPTHLFHFLTYVEQFRGSGGRGIKRAIANWYQDLPVDKLAFETIKYQSRDGWSNADALRISHPKTSDPVRNFVYKYIVDGLEAAIKQANERGITDLPLKVPNIIGMFEATKKEDADIPGLIKHGALTREMVPTESLKDPKVWEQLLANMPLTAMIRNLGNLSKCGLLVPLSATARLVREKLSDRDNLKKARVHPIQLLIAQKVYAQGHGMLGKGQWNPVSTVVDALDDAFYAAFDYLEPTGKRFIVGVDVSGSMHIQIANIPGWSAAQGAAAMALACIKTETEYEILCFDTGVVSRPKLTKNMRLKDVEKEVIKNGGGTNCAVPIEWAIKNRIEADCILILTDSETWAGRLGHPSQIMRDYRSKINQDARIVNLGMVATNISINDPDDALALDVAGFDASVPAIISDFVKEN